jgi:hypothetical protein
LPTRILSLGESQTYAHFRFHVIIADRLPLRTPKASYYPYSNALSPPAGHAVGYSGDDLRGAGQ